MAVPSTYSDLQTEVCDLAWRSSDADFMTKAASFIGYAGARFNRILDLRVMDVDTTLTGTTSSRNLALPSDYLNPISLYLTTFEEFTKLRKSVAGDMPLSYENGIPDAWCINGTNIELDTPCDQAHTFRFRYRQSFVLSDSTTTNWLLTNHPDLYVAGALVWGGVFMKDSEEAVRWKTILEEGIEELTWNESRSREGLLTVDPALAGRDGFSITEG